MSSQEINPLNSGQVSRKVGRIILKGIWRNGKSAFSFSWPGYFYPVAPMFGQSREKYNPAPSHETFPYAFQYVVVMSLYLLMMMDDDDSSSHTRRSRWRSSSPTINRRITKCDHCDFAMPENDKVPRRATSMRMGRGRRKKTLEIEIKDSLW